MEIKKDEIKVINGVRIEGLGHDLVRAVAPAGYHWTARSGGTSYGPVIYDDVFTDISKKYLLVIDDPINCNLPDNIDLGHYDTDK